MKKLNVKLPQGGSKRALHSGMYASALAVVVLAVLLAVVAQNVVLIYAIIYLFPLKKLHLVKQ